MTDQPPPRSGNSVARDGLAALVIVLLAAALVATVITHFVS